VGQVQEPGIYSNSLKECRYNWLVEIQNRCKRKKGLSLGPFEVGKRKSWER
jgi:hypothetical protein